MIRVLLPEAREGALDVTGPRLHYLARVLRVTPGAELEVFDGRGSRFTATVASLTTERAVLDVGAPRAAPPSRPVTVVQGLPKGDKLELVFQKCTELGASAFITAACARSIVKLEGKETAKRERWQRIVEEAARQCGRADVPEVQGPVKLGELTSQLASGTTVLVLDEEERSVTLREGVAAAGDGPLALVIGPEGGLTREEVDGLVTRGALGVTLGPQVLRTETAALAALTVVRHLDGLLG